jgi:hypothetical protein
MSSVDGILRLKDRIERARQEGDKLAEGESLSELGLDFEKSQEYDKALACYLLAMRIGEELKDPEARLTQSNIDRLIAALGGKRFSQLMRRVGPKADKVVEKILKEN